MNIRILPVLQNASLQFTGNEHCFRASLSASTWLLE